MNRAGAMRIRVRILAAGIGLVALATASTVAAAGKWPHLTGDAAAPECADARLLARTMFESGAPRVYAPLRIPAAMASELVLGAMDQDISGGDALTASPAFEKIRQGNGRSIYWERAPDADARIVVRERSRGWRGDVYSLSLPDARVEPSEFMRGLAAGEGGHPPHETPIAGEWRPPLVFHSKANGGMWFLRIGQSFVPLDEWRVFGVRSGRYSQLCAITFRPQMGTMEALLPGRVRVLVRLLDETIGPGEGEGTMQQTAWLRNGVQHVIANVALRPWAVSGTDAYNSRDEVDAGLASWAVNAPRRALLSRIERAYPLAGRDLAAYYRSELGMLEDKARAEAARVLDVLFRAHYVFAKR
jgi:hypothetical protein